MKRILAILATACLIHTACSSGGSIVEGTVVTAGKVIRNVVGSTLTQARERLDNEGIFYQTYVNGEFKDSFLFIGDKHYLVESSKPVAGPRSHPETLSFST